MKFVKEADSDEGWGKGLGPRQADMVEFLKEDGIVTADSIEDGEIKYIFLNGDEYQEKTDREFQKFKPMANRLKDHDGVVATRIKTDGTKSNGLRFDLDELDTDDAFGNELMKVFKDAQAEFEEHLKAAEEAEAEDEVEEPESDDE